MTTLKSEIDDNERRGTKTAKMTTNESDDEYETGDDNTDDDDNNGDEVCYND